MSDLGAALTTFAETHSTTGRYWRSKADFSAGFHARDAAVERLREALARIASGNVDRNEACDSLHPEETAEGIARAALDALSSGSKEEQ